MKNDVILVGGFHEIIELCGMCDYNIKGIIDNKLTGTYYGIPIIGRDDDASYLFNKYKECKIVVTPDSPSIREKLVTLYSSIGFKFTSIISPLAQISKYAKIGIGTIVQSGVNISAATKIGDFCKLNSNSNVMHDNVIGNYTTIAPNAVLLGNVNTGVKTYIGANSTILPNIHIDDEAIIGAGAVVTHNIDMAKTVKGVPAK
jgi:sugar O-acyltransferase (sialic acid O-acetyltransferase NeuD family)